MCIQQPKVSHHDPQGDDHQNHGKHPDDKIEEKNLVSDFELIPGEAVGCQGSQSHADDHGDQSHLEAVGNQPWVSRAGPDRGVVGQSEIFRDILQFIGDNVGFWFERSDQSPDNWEDAVENNQPQQQDDQ